MHQERSGDRKEKEEKTPEEGHYRRRCRGLNERSFMESRFVRISWDYLIQTCQTIVDFQDSK
jgi:hypothetical protein